MFATLALAAAVLQGDAGRDLTRLIPVYAEPAAFGSKPGERIRLGAYMPPKDRLQERTALGVNLFVGLAPPDQGAGPFSLENLKAQQAAAQEAGAKWGLDLYSAFPTFDESTVIGEGTVEVRSKERIPAFSPWSATATSPRRTPPGA
jgi:hypothetical protein